MPTAEFSVSFDGPALEHHSMQVRDLAPALLALGESINAAAAITDPSADLPGLAIKATGEGSFIVVLQLADPSMLHRIQDFLVGDGVTATLNAHELLITVLGGYAVVKWLKGRRIKTVQVDLPAAGQVRIVDERGDSIEVPSASWQAAQDLNFREAAKSAVQPLERDGIDLIDFQTAPEVTAPTLRITKDDRSAFEVPAVVETPILDTEYETVLRLVNIAFNEDHKWKVTEGDSPFWVQIDDMAFLERVQLGEERFSAGDLLRVRLRHQQWSTATGPRSDRSVVEVLQHIVGPRQIALPFADDAGVE